MRNKGKIRVLQVITRLGLGGAEQVAMSIIRELRGQVESAVFTVHGRDDDEVGRGMEQSLRDWGVPWFQGTRVPMKAGGPVPAAWALARAVREFAPDVLHCHAEPAEATVATWRAILGGAQHPLRVLRTIHNSVFWRYWPRVGRWTDRRLADASVVAVSEAARAEFFRYRVDSAAAAVPEVDVIYNGVALDPIPPRPPISPDVRRVLFAGRFEDQKGVDLLARALPQVKLPDGVRGELTLVGHGFHESMLRGLVAAPPASWVVVVRPPVSRLALEFTAHDLVVMPSRFEGLGLVAVEATLCGLPLVATAAPGLREALPPEHPWWVRVEDERDLARVLTRALGETTRWADAVNSAQKFASERFAPQAMAERYKEVFATARLRGSEGIVGP